ncbi:MAG: hypothetical protein ABW034_17760 [Steroidobacteraceae bacterium]
MDVIGGGSVVIRGPDDEGPHPASSDEWWQESVTLIWWDLDRYVGGFHRIGHEPNFKQGPHVCLTNSLFTRDHVYRRSEFIPMRPEDTLPNGFAGGNGHCRFEFVDGKAKWTLRDAEVSMDVIATDYHIPIDIWPKSGELGKDVAPEHMEVASAVTGKVTVAGKDYTINGAAFRDHGWGIRHWDKIMVYRWVVGVFDATLSVFAMTFLSPDGTMSSFGLVSKDNKLIRAEKVDIVTYIEADGFTHRGGHVKLKLATGEVMDLECEILQKGTVNSHHGNTWLDTFCKMTWGNKVGVCDFEIANRPFQGTRKPVCLQKAIAENGLFPASI